jgi:hypothetical protein
VAVAHHGKSVRHGRDRTGQMPQRATVAAVIPSSVAAAYFGTGRTPSLESVTRQPLGEGTGAATASVVRLSADTDYGRITVVAKTLRPLASGRHAAGAADPAHWAYWRREALAYASGLLPAGPALRAPRCYGVVRDTVYLEDVPDIPQFAGIAAERLTEWQARTPVPDRRWLARNQLAQRIAVSDLDWTAAGLDKKLAGIWARRHALLDDLAGVPTVVSHGDFHCGQIKSAGEGTVVLDWGTFGTAPAGTDHAHLALSVVADLSDRLPDPAKPGYRTTLLLTGASRAHWMATRGIPLPDGYADLLSSMV